MRPMDIPVSHLPNVIFACFVLHNFCKRENVDVDKQVVEQVIQEESCGIIKVDKLNSYLYYADRNESQKFNYSLSQSVFVNLYYIYIVFMTCNKIQIL